MAITPAPPSRRMPSSFPSIAAQLTMSHLQGLSQEEAPPPLHQLLDAKLSPSLTARLPDPHVNGILLQSNCSARQQLDEAFLVLSQTHRPLPISSYISLLKDCSKQRSLFHARRVHSHLQLHRVHLDGFLGDYLAMTLAKCGAVDDAWQLTASLQHITVFSWTAIISAYAESGRGEEALQIYQCMQREGIVPDNFTLVSVFKACGSIPNLSFGKQLHAYVQSEGLTSNSFIGNTIVSMYGKCGALKEAEDTFNMLSFRDTVSWNGMLSAYVEQGENVRALQLYRQMQEEKIYPDEATFVIVVQACGNHAEEEDDASSMSYKSLVTASFEIGQAIHADARKLHFTSNVLVGTAIVSMYGRCGEVVSAEHLFEGLVRRDTVAWNAMLSAYIENEQGENALSFFWYMQKQEAPPDQLTYILAVQACGIMGEKEGAFSEGKTENAIFLEIGRALHLDVERNGFVENVAIANTLISMYGKCGFVEQAENVFNTLHGRDIISWNAMLSACNEQGQGEKTLALYKEMQQKRLELNEITLTCILQACSDTGNLVICEKVHFDIVTSYLDSISPLVATLINTYGSCSRTADAISVFDECSERNPVVWNACIAGHIGDEDPLASLYLFENLKLADIVPDDVTFTSVLSVCSHNSLVVEGLEYFASISIGNIERTHYNIVIDLLGRAGDFKRIQNILRMMPMQPDVTVWQCILGACSTHSNLEMAKIAFDNAVQLYPMQSIPYVLMSNIYVDAGLLETGDHSRRKAEAF